MLALIFPKLRKPCIDRSLLCKEMNTHLVSAGSFELARWNVRLLRFDRRHFLHRFSCVRHLGRGVEIKLAFGLAVGLRFRPPNALRGTIDEIGALRRRTVERLRRPERYRRTVEFYPARRRNTATLVCSSSTQFGVGVPWNRYHFSVVQLPSLQSRQLEVGTPLVRSCSCTQFEVGSPSNGTSNGTTLAWCSYPV